MGKDALSRTRYSERAFPPYRHEPGKTPHPERHPDGHMYGREPASEEDDFLYGVDLFNAAYWWEAHVYFERLWAETPFADEREFLQGLIQLAAALVKRREGSAAGDAKLKAKALEKLLHTRERSGVCMGVRLDPLIANIQIEDGGSIVIVIEHRP